MLRACGMNPGRPLGLRERVPAVEWIQAALLAAGITWTVLGLGGYRPGTMVVTLALTGALVVVHCLACAFEGRPLAAVDRAGWWLLPFLAYALLNVLWVTPVPWLGWLDWLAWANMFALFWVVRNGIRSGPARRALFFAVVLLGIGAVVLACYQRFVQPDWLMLGRRQAEQFLGRASGPFGIPNSLAGFLLLLIPATGALAWRRDATATERVWWSWVTLVLALGLLLTVSRGGWLALALVLTVWPLLERRWRWRRRLLAAVGVLVLVLGTGTIVYRTLPAVRDRFDRMVMQSGELSRPILWRAAWRIFQASPILGGGAGSYNNRFEGHRPAGFRDDPQWAHSDALNTLSDYGVAGLVLLLGGIGVVVVRRRNVNTGREPRASIALESSVVRRALGLGLVAFGLHALVDFHLKIPGLAMTAACVAALALGPPSKTVAPARRNSAVSRVGWLGVAIVAGVANVPALRLVRAEALRYQVREQVVALVAQRPADLPTQLHEAELTLLRATLLAPQHGGVWSELAHVLTLRAWAQPTLGSMLAAPAVDAASRATRSADIVPEFWMRRGVALDLAGCAGEARAAFERALALAPQRADAWYYYAYHLSLATEHRDEALRAIATCLSLDPGNAGAEALRVKLNERPRGAPFNP